MDNTDILLTNSPVDDTTGKRLWSPGEDAVTPETAWLVSLPATRPAETTLTSRAKELEIYNNHTELQKSQPTNSLSQ